MPSYLDEYLNLRSDQSAAPQLPDTTQPQIIYLDSYLAPEVEKPKTPSFSDLEKQPPIKQVPQQPTSQIGSLLAAGAKVLDFSQRGRYAITKFLDSEGEDATNVAGALSAAKKEFTDPKDRLNYADLIKKNFPDFAAKHPI